VPLREEGTGTGPPAGSTPRPGSSCPAAALRPPTRPRRAPARGARCPATSAAASKRTVTPSPPPGLHRPDIRHQAALRSIASAQVRLLRTENLQASAPPNSPGPIVAHSGDPKQVVCALTSACAVNLPAGRRKPGMHARPQAGGRRFGPYGAERRGQRTRRQRKAATRGQVRRRAEGCVPGAVRCTPSAGIYRAGTRVLMQRPGPDAGTVPRVISCPADVLRCRACGSAGCGWCDRESELRP
jgi:hypothetical protein